jgi:hypothetical protein
MLWEQLHGEWIMSSQSFKQQMHTLAKMHCTYKQPYYAFDTWWINWQNNHALVRLHITNSAFFT